MPPRPGESSAHGPQLEPTPAEATTTVGPRSPAGPEHRDAPTVEWPRPWPPPAPDDVWWHAEPTDEDSAAHEGAEPPVVEKAAELLVVGQAAEPPAVREAAGLLAVGEA